MVLGELGPAMGIATVEKVAIAGVMAGCKPDYMPILIAAVKAVADPRFDLGELQATTHCTAPLIIVNGPVRHACAVASGIWRARPRPPRQCQYWPRAAFVPHQHRWRQAGCLRHGAARSPG